MMAEGRKRYRPENATPIEASDRDAVAGFVSAHWGSPHIVTRARNHDVRDLPGFILRDGDEVMGVLTLSIQGPECEVVTIDAAVEDMGIGSAMLEQAEVMARDAGCDRMWLVTTNDNLRALGFYQLRGYRIMAVHRNAALRARELKPEIPPRAANGIPIVDEIELEKELGPAGRVSEG